jgi:hypothetical protein
LQTQENQGFGEFGCEKNPAYLLFFLYKKQYIEGKNKKKRRENGSYRRKV